ncbi:hypothetical protein TU94_01365 [Streptomyces cyaneogriseus subsp. noncyanogenus]|uniref:Aminoglycoside phosphotransferase domain-containing protein n=1 Tax=Streptomyces cyaneogriseus subsp. noncyanogenus TaxID=477245 RepID=A0A0C5FX65_9ACTN|nr:hypothetical protein [Streptomyces cyaneogriseus]AJP00384.1 hypothetical protein TU94_01365 [Streptomyces cyaneogriseus subsp. noncyanogenus]
MTGRATDTVVVPERGTALRRSAVLRAGDQGFLWIRRAGPRAPAPLHTLDRGTRADIAALSTPAGSRLVTGTDAGRWRGFPVRAAHSLLEEIATGRRPSGGPVLAALEELGRLLRLLHDHVPPAALPPAPASLDRLRHRPENGRGPSPRAVEILTAVQDGITPRRRTLLRQWTDDLSDGDVATHGWCGLGQVAAEAGGPLDLTVGDDMGRAARELDLGFVIGQLRELETFAAAPGMPLREAATRLLRAYGPCDARRAARAAALGVALHIHDFACYFDVDDAEIPVWTALLSDLVDEAAA